MKQLYSLFALFSISVILQADDGFESLFNGKNLDGWDGSPEHWRVDNGIIIGTCSGPDDLSNNTFLIWQNGILKNFELKATVRIVGDNNSGIQYRSRKIPDIGQWAISGYQSDIHPAIEHTGMTYEEKARGIFGLNGVHVILDDEGNRWQTSKHNPVKADVNQWNEYTIIARGNHLIHKVNGLTTSELIDNHKEGRALEGLLAIQLHRGNPNSVEIKDIRLKTLPDGKVLPFDPSILAKTANKIAKRRTVNP